MIPTELLETDLDNLSIHDISRLRMVAKDGLKALADAEKTIKEAIKKLEENALTYMQEQKMDTLNNEYANVSKREEKYPSVEDWPALVQYIVENEAYQLFERRLSKGSFNETCKIACCDTLPGVGVYEKEIVKFSDRRNKAN